MVKRSGGGFVIKDNPPLVYHDQSINLESERDNLIGAFAAYRETLADDRRVLLDRYRIVDFAVKVVGVGSVGTFCGIFLLMDDDDQPLFLQVKEARASVLEAYLGKSTYPNHAQRVVIGQRLMQSASDIFLGWTAGQRKRHFYCRQLRDMKLKFLVEVFNPATMRDFAALCGRTLARAHARSGDAAAIGERATSSIVPSPASRAPMPTKPSATTPPSSAPSARDGSRSGRKPDSTAGTSALP